MSLTDSRVFPLDRIFLLFLSIGLLGALAVAQQAHAQDEAPPATMPEGWQQLDAAAFASATDDVFTADPGPEQDHVVAMTTHAWTAFLRDEDFVVRGDWAVVQKLLDQYQRRWRLLVTGDTEEDQIASQEAIALDRQQVTTWLRQRLSEQPATINGLDFQQLLSTNTTLYHAGMDHPERVSKFAQWMNANDWQAMDTNELSHLFSVLQVDEVDRGEMSVRWTGYLTVPADGSYVFSLLKGYDQVPATRVWLDGQQVIDSTDEEAEDPTRSITLEMVAGQRVPIQVELVSEGAALHAYRSYPLMVLMWETDQMTRTYVPSSAYTPPDDFDAGGEEHGLRGEYFADTQFEDSKLTVLDPSLQLIWNLATAANRYRTERDQILDFLMPRLIGGTLLSHPDVEPGVLIRHVTTRMGAGMNASQRSQFALALAVNPQLFESLGVGGVPGVMQLFMMLPNDERVMLSGLWSQAHPDWQVQPGIYPGWGGGRYRSINHDPWWVIGRQFKGPHREDAVKLFEGYARNADGSCNIAVIRMIAFAAKIDNWGYDLQAMMAQVLEDPDLSSDVRASWLIAQGYVAEVAVFDMPRPVMGLGPAEEAFGLAEGQATRYWALQELVARLITLGELAEAQGLVDSVRDQFTQEEQATLDEWLERGEGIVAHYERVDEAQRDVPARHHLGVLQQRLSDAQESGETGRAERYQRLIQAVESELED